MNNEAKVGLFALLGIILAITVIILVGKVTFVRSGEKIYVDFNFIGDLREGAKVQYRGGVQIGFVDSIQVTEEDRVRVAVIIENEDVVLREGSQFGIHTVGLGLGEKYVLVLPSSRADAPPIEPNSIVRGTDPMSLEGTIGYLGTFADELSADDFTMLVKNLLELLVVVNSLVSESQKNISAFSDNMYDLTSDLKRISEIVTDNEDNIRKTIQNAESTIRHLDLAIQTLDSTVSNVNMVATTDLQEALKEINFLVKRVNAGEGSVGKLVKEEDVYNDLKIAAENLRYISDEIRRNPSSLLFGMDDKKVRKSE